MSKYDGLMRYLADSAGVVELSFEDVEEIIGFSLPTSARRYPAWWSNSGGTHVQAEAWMNAGYRTEDVNIVLGKIRFVPERRVGLAEMKQSKYEPSEVGKRQTEGKSRTEGARHPAFGALKGLITIAPDVDLAQPTYEDWKSLYGESE